jgi:phosphonopyruvate decarboxylase
VIPAEAFCARLADAGYHTTSGVPCSWLQGPFAILERTPGYLAAPNEGIALSVAAGAELAGRPAAVLAQNSGVGNLLDPLTSLFMSYRLPLLLFVSLRGYPDAADDEEHHTVMGSSTRRIFEAVGLTTHELRGDEQDLDKALSRAADERRAGSPLVVLVPRHTVGPHPASGPTAAPVAARPPAWQRRAALEALLPHLRNTLIITTTGMISRELYGLADRPEHFYMQGSMGQAIGLGIGAATARPARRVVVLDGDGAALMQMGGMALAGEAAPANLLHVILDNGVYDSTGGQRTRNHQVDWAKLAAGLGYRSGHQCQDASSLREAVRAVEGTDGPHLIGISISPGGAAVPPRISQSWTNAQIARRFTAAATAPLDVEKG